MKVNLPTKRSGLLGLIVVALVVFPSVTYAGYALEIGLGQVTEVENLTEYLQQIYVFLVGAVGIVATTMVMWGGVKWILAAGSPEKINDARRTIIEAIVGLILALGSYTILSVLNEQLVTLRLPSINEIALPNPPPTATELSLCASGGIACTTVDDCTSTCTADEFTGVNWSCGSTTDGNFCIFTRTNSADGSYCRSAADCASGLCVIAAGVSFGACSGLGENDQCDPASGCVDASLSCELKIDGGWFGTDYYQCVKSTARSYGSVCTSSSECGPSMVCKDFGSVAGKYCSYQYESDCQNNLPNPGQCSASVDCRTNIGGDCVSPDFCCDSSLYGTGRCDEAHRGSCVQ